MSNPPHRWLRAGFALAGIIAILTVCGCGGQPKAKVSGSVTLDGVPVEKGIIQFYPTGTSGQTAGAGIEHGKYSIEASVGEMKVTINASKVVGKNKMYDTPDSPVIDKVAEIIPAKYHSPSELKVTLSPGANENVNFDLKTK